MHRFKVEKMGCGGCAKSVTRAIQGIEPNAGSRSNSEPSS